jgi:hypothetical protein
MADPGDRRYCLPAFRRTLGFKAAAVISVSSESAGHLKDGAQVRAGCPQKQR